MYQNQGPERSFRERFAARFRAACDGGFRPTEISLFRDLRHAANAAGTGVSDGTYNAA